MYVCVCCVPVCVCISNIIKHIAISLAVFYEALQPASRTMKNENQFSGSTLELERIKMATVTVTVTQNNSRTGEVCGEERALERLATFCAL